MSSKRVLVGFPWLFLIATVCSNTVLAQEIECGVQPAAHHKSHAHKSHISRSKIKLFPAVVAKTQGRVFLNERGGKVLANQLPVYEGQAILLNDVIETANQSFITIRLGDGTLSSLPSNTRVRLSQASSTVARYVLDIGEIHSQVKKAAKARANTFEVQTPGSMIGVRGTDFVVRHDEQLPYFVTSVEQGTVWVRPLASCAKPTVVNKGFGAVLTDAPKSVAILPAPELNNPDKAQPQAAMQFELKPIKGAAKYRAQIVGDLNLMEVLSEQYSNTSTISFAQQKVPNGYYYVRLTAYDVDGVPSLSSETLFLRNKNQFDDK